jgi:prolyl oligopeptidase
VPISILIPKGAKLDGSNPCLVTGYGGYASNSEPVFRPESRVLFDHGFVVAVVNCGAAGSTARSGTGPHADQKAERVRRLRRGAPVLIDASNTSAEKLAIEGGSNGGLLMGATLTQHPELMKCVISHVGIYDMLRWNSRPTGRSTSRSSGREGRGAVQGAVRVLAVPQRQGRDEVPRGAVPDGSERPAGGPVQSRKFTARLQAAQDVGDVPVAHERQFRARVGHRPVGADRGEDRRLRLSSSPNSG